MSDPVVPAAAPAEADDGGNKYLARSFVLPLIMGVAFSVLVFYDKFKTEREMGLVALALLGFAGLFQVDQVVKTIWAARSAPPTEGAK